jgi:hypothetical protein
MNEAGKRQYSSAINSLRLHHNPPCGKDAFISRSFFWMMTMPKLPNPTSFCVVMSGDGNEHSSHR